MHFEVLRIAGVRNSVCASLRICYVKYKLPSKRSYRRKDGSDKKTKKKA